MEDNDSSYSRDWRFSKEIISHDHLIFFDRKILIEPMTANYSPHVDLLPVWKFTRW